MISPVLLSEVSLPDYHPRAGAACVVYGFVIHHRDGPVLVDTGVGRGNAEIDRFFMPVQHTIDEALAGVGVHRTEITMVINTHLHFDHCGNNMLFAGIPLVVQQSEYTATLQLHYTIPEWVGFPGAVWTPVEGQEEVLPGITVVPTPGHTVGHQSILVSYGKKRDVIAGQAVYDGDELDDGASIEPLDETEAEQTSASVEHIKAISPDRVFFSHDARVWTPYVGNDVAEEGV